VHDNEGIELVWPKKIINIAGIREVVELEQLRQIIGIKTSLVHNSAGMSIKIYRRVRADVVDVNHVKKFYVKRRGLYLKNILGAAY